MFATAAKNFVDEVDHGGLLIPSSSLNDAIALLTVVVKRKRFWFWQKPKCILTDFTLNDLLTGDAPIQPVVLESDFIKYTQTTGDHIQAGVDAQGPRSQVSVGGQETIKLQSSFGSLKKEEVDVRRLFLDSKGRVLDMSHSLIQQILQKKKQIFSVVRERIVTAQPCSVVEDVQEAGQCGGMMGLCSPVSPKLQLKENGSVTKDNNVTMEIPAHTALAYALIELEIKHDGHYELCLMPDTRGGFEMDSAAHAQLMGSGACSSAADLSSDLLTLSPHFLLLRSLPADTRSALLQRLATLVQDRTALSALDSQLEQVCLGKSPVLSDGTDAQKELIRSTLQLLEAPGDGGQAPSPVLVALHLVVSALCEMRGDSLAALEGGCSPAELRYLDQMVCQISGVADSEPGAAALGAPAEDEVLSRARRLLAWSRVSVTKDGDQLKTDTQEAQWNFLLITCIAVRGLSSLSI